MPVNTVSSNQVTIVNGRPQVKPNIAAGGQNRSRPRGQYQTYQCRAEQLTPLLDLVKPGQPVSADCEGGILDGEVGRDKKALLRVGITNALTGECIYDTFVYYPKNVAHRPPPQRLNLGVTYKDILPKNGAQPHAEVLKAIKTIFDKSGVIIGHAFHNDEDMMRGIDFSKYKIHDTQQIYATYGDPTPGLKSLVSRHLEKSIQTGPHSPVEDARATAELYFHYNKTSGSDQDSCPYPSILSSSILDLDAEEGDSTVATSVDSTAEQLVAVAPVAAAPVAVTPIAAAPVVTTPVVTTPVVGAPVAACPVMPMMSYAMALRRK